MKIAIYEPESMLGGLQTWAHHLRTGLRALGHEADWVTFTRSGRPRSTWELKPDSFALKQRLWPYDHVVKYTAAVEFLNGYDGVILNDPRSYIQDLAAQRGTATVEPGVPDYLAVLRRVRVPVTVGIHCSRYERKQFPYLEQLLGIDTLTDTLVTHSERAFREMLTEMPEWAAHDHRSVPLPYAPSCPSSPSRNYISSAGAGGAPVVGLVGRYTGVKGHRALAAAWAYGDLGRLADVQLWGGCDVFRGPAASTVTYEALLAALPVLGGAIQEGSGATARPWRLDHPDVGTKMTYSGYTDTLATHARLHVAVNLTTTEASGGALEYAQLEAIDVGCALVAPVHRWDDRYCGDTLEWVGRWPSDAKLAKTVAEGTGRLAIDVITAAVASAICWSDQAAAERRAHNREVLREVHDPATVASAYVDALTS